jgi:hypothetical protein
LDPLVAADGGADGHADEKFRSCPGGDDNGHHPHGLSIDVPFNSGTTAARRKLIDDQLAVSGIPKRKTSDNGFPPVVRPQVENSGVFKNRSRPVPTIPSEAKADTQQTCNGRSENQ